MEFQAHIPIVPNDGTSLDTASFVETPWKSWFYYSQLNSNEPHYYSFEAEAGDRIRLMLSIPIADGDSGFGPSVILMGAVYDASMGGNYAFVTGYVEEYSLAEWITVPFMVMTILQWTGQNLLFILLPMVLPLILGLIFLFQKDRTSFSKERLPELFAISGILLFLGSSVSIFGQMLYALIQAPSNWTIIATIIFGALPVLLSVFVLMIVHPVDWKNSRGKKIRLLVIAIIAPFVWAGLLIGPALVGLSAVSAHIMAE